MFESHLIEGENWERWLHAIRRREFELLFERVPAGGEARVLELGSGDGFQLDLLRRRFTRVTALDPFRAPAEPRGFVFARAEALPFADASFDLVCSSNVLEHVDDRPRSLQESLRVLRPGGYLAHAMPSRVWKAFNLLLHPLGYGLHLAGKWSLGRRRGGAAAAGAAGVNAPRPTLAGLLRKCFCPEIHGSFPTHAAEFRAYGRGPWRRLLADRRLEWVAEVPLLTYSEFGLLRGRLLAARHTLARCGLSSCHAFVLRKIA